jgi:hypothetical protein
MEDLGYIFRRFKKFDGKINLESFIDEMQPKFEI